MADSYTLEFMDSNRILVFTTLENYAIATDTVHSTADIFQLLNQLSQPIVYVSNLLSLRPTFDELLMGASMLARGKSPIYHHPNMKKLIVVTADEALANSYRGLASNTFGNVQAHIYPTLEEAMAEARASV